jgi:uncharacterized repeat protein (TIGR01451 family)
MNRREPARKPQLRPFLVALILTAVFLRIALGLPGFAPAASTSNLWTEAAVPQTSLLASSFWVQPQTFRTFTLDQGILGPVLSVAPAERPGGLASSEAIITLPMPDGSMARFKFVESPILPPPLAARFPQIQTFLAQGLDDPSATARFDITQQGFHAQILSPSGAVYIEPLLRGNANLHVSFYKRDYRRVIEPLQCLVPDLPELRPDTRQGSLMVTSGANLRTYRLAVAATGEYTQFQGGAVADGLAGIVTAINRVDGIYESEVAIRFMLVTNNDQIVYTDPDTDPYDNFDGFAMMGQNQSNLDFVIGNTNYDVGHVFSTGGGGIATLGVVCVTGSKAKGATGLSQPVGDAFYVDYVAHELGHEFGATHPFNSVIGSCGSGNRYAPTAVEPGSGSTIMAYAGLCGSDDLQPHSDPYFNEISLEQIVGYTTSGAGSSCPVVTTTSNTPPVAFTSTNFFIPTGTPFSLSATSSDADGDPVTYCWEEQDVGPATTLLAPDNGSSPLFRSFSPTTNASRTFPRWQDILNNTKTPGEMLPQTNRIMLFTVTVRDNRAGGGGVNTSTTTVIVATNAGPFRVTAPAPASTLSGNQPVSWDVAGTSNAPVSTMNVDILLSTNAGQSFSILLASNAPNSGAASVVLPDISCPQALIEVRAVSNSFFAVSPGTFNIVPSTPQPAIVFDSVELSAESCPPGNGAIDPGETVTLSLGLKNVGAGSTSNLVATLLPGGGVTSPSPPQTYGALVPGNKGVPLPFSLTATGACGGTLTATLQLQDGDKDLGTLSRSFNLGAMVATTVSATNPGQINIPGTGTQGPGSPYPSTILLSGVSGVVSKVTVLLKGLSHTFPSDVDVMLVGPTGQSVVLMSSAGEGDQISGVDLTFDDNASQSLPNASAITTGAYKPTNYSSPTNNFYPGAPAGPYGQTLAGFSGLNPNGAWSLYAQDHASQDAGVLAGGWSINLTVSNSVCCIPPPAADLALGVTASALLINSGTQLVYSISLTNFGPSNADSVVVTDALPATVSFVSATNSLGTIFQTNQTVAWSVPSLPNGSNASASITVVTSGSGTITNFVLASSATPDPNATNNSASCVVTLNTPPFISSIPDQSADENVSNVPVSFIIGDAETSADLLTLSAASSDTNLVPATNLVFGGSSSNRNLTITPAPYHFGSATITVTVSDGLASTSTNFLLTIRSVNHPPILSPIADRTLHAGSLLTVTNSASDPDIPPNNLTFSLDPGAPPAATINSTNGLLLWPTADTDANTTNTIAVRVTDDGTPALSDAKSFIATVVSRPAFLSITLVSNAISLTWNSIAGQGYRLQRSDILPPTNWQSSGPDVVAGGSSTSYLDTNAPAAQRFYRVLVVP